MFDDDSHVENNHQAEFVSYVSIVLYLLIATLAFYYYRKFSPDQSRSDNQGRFDHAKKSFFGVLVGSSLLEIPQYISCLAHDCPIDCNVYSLDYILFKAFHILALCGYAYCIILPCILWSDTVQDKDGKIFFSSHSYSLIKRYFQLLLCLTFMNALLEIALSAILYGYYYESQYDGIPWKLELTYIYCGLIESILIFLISCGCLFCGIQLQLYVRRVRLDVFMEMKVLFRLNLILVVIVLTFLGRAIIVGRFGLFFIRYKYVVFITGWAPYVICQLLLIYIMRLSGKEAMMTNSKKIPNRMERLMTEEKEEGDTMVDPLLLLIADDAVDHQSGSQVLSRSGDLFTSNFNLDSNLL